MYDLSSSTESVYKGYTLLIKEESTICLPYEVAGFGFVKQGVIYLSGADIKEKRVEEKSLIFFPPGIVCSISSLSEASVFILEVPEITSICHRFLSDTIFRKATQKEIFFSTLLIHPYIENIINTTDTYIREGFTDSYLIQIKVNEFFHFINRYYSEDLLNVFFSPILSEKYYFTHFVLSFHSSVKTVEELARLSTYSLSGFDKEFRKVFGIAPYKWMLQMKTESIYRDIEETSKPLKLIAKEHNFETPSRLSDFCRRHMGCSPSAIRKKVKNREMTN